METLTAHTQELVTMAVVLLMAMLVYITVRRGLTLLARRHYLPPAMETLLRGMTRWLLIVVVVLLALQQAGIPMTSVWAALSAVALMISIGFVAVWSVVSNVFCSVLLLVFQPFRLGDDVEVMETLGGGGLRGKVVSMNAFYTTLEEDSRAPGNGGGILKIPNNVFFMKAMRTWTGQETQRLNVVFGAKRGGTDDPHRTEEGPLDAMGTF